MDERPVVFSQTFEGLFLQGLKGRVTPALKDRLRELGLELDRPLAPAYPVEVWNGALAAAAAEVFPALSSLDAHEALGVAFLTGYAHTLMGRAMMALLRVLGPKRALERMERNFRSGNNYVKTRFVDHGGEDVEVLFDVMYEVPTFMKGVILHGARELGARDVRIDVSDTDRPRSYRVRWTAG